MDMAKPIAGSWDAEVHGNSRFRFGSNWKDFSRTIGDERIARCREELSTWLGPDLDGLSFLDLGCGSGIHSLAAVSLGADVLSFDYDTDSVECTEALRERFYRSSNGWTVQQGSALDESYMSSLGQFDVVYSWGVLHHTGDMWRAINHAAAAVHESGRLFIAIYNDQGWKSRFWWHVKNVYSRLPDGLNKAYAVSLGTFFHAANILKYTARLQPMKAIRPLLNYKKNRGMSVYHDVVDWMGGFPYEYATYEKLKSHIEEQGFELVKGQKNTSLGCHQMVFRRVR